MLEVALEGRDGGLKHVVFGIGIFHECAILKVDGLLERDEFLEVVLGDGGILHEGGILGVEVLLIPDEVLQVSLAFNPGLLGVIGACQGQPRSF